MFIPVRYQGVRKIVATRTSDNAKEGPRDAVPISWTSPYPAPRCRRELRKIWYNVTAMTVDSPEGRAQIKTLGELRTKAGIQFDPVAVDVFVKTYRPEEGSPGVGA